MQEKQERAMNIHGKKITTIISDLDGTLLGEKRIMDPALFPVIKELKKRGVAFVAASGRQYKNMKLTLEPIVDETPFICENGSLIVKNDETVYIKYIPKELSFALLADMLTVPGTETIVSSERSLYTLACRTEFIRYMNEFLKPEVCTVDDYHEIPGGFNKISIWWRDGIPEEKERWFHEKYDDRLQVADAGNGWLDFTMDGANKGMALRELANRDGIRLDEALCFGDSDNDIAMFRECAISYAMASGKDLVKAEADYICSDVGDTLREFLAADDRAR